MWCIYMSGLALHSCFFFNDTATTEIYTLSLHDALPICRLHAAREEPQDHRPGQPAQQPADRRGQGQRLRGRAHRSEEHTSELQSRLHLVCRLLLEKKKKIQDQTHLFKSHTTSLTTYILLRITYTVQRHHL